MVETALGILLQKQNHTEDAIFGKVVSGRSGNFDGIEEMAGLFINTVVKRIRCTNEETISSVLQRVQRDSNESTKYDYIGLTEIQSQSSLKGNLIKTIFAFENYYVSNSETENTAATEAESVISIESSREETSYDISFAASVSEQLLLKVLYNPTIYAEAEVSQILERLKYLLLQMIADTTKQIGQLVSDAARGRISSFEYV